jgi:hypothetical protein
MVCSLYLGREGRTPLTRGALQLPIIKLLLTDQARFPQAIIPFPTPFYAWCDKPPHSEDRQPVFTNHIGIFPQPVTLECKKEPNRQIFTPQFKEIGGFTMPFVFDSRLPAWVALRLMTPSGHLRTTSQVCWLDFGLISGVKYVGCAGRFAIYLRFCS